MTVFDRAPLSVINARVTDIRIGRMLAVVVGGMLYLVGWLPATAVRASVRAVRWCAAAVVVGWSEGMTRRDGGST